MSAVVVDWGVVSSLELGKVAALGMSTITSRVSVQLSPNRLREDYDYETMDVFPDFPVSPRHEWYFPSVSPISSPGALSTPGSPPPVTT